MKKTFVLFSWATLAISFSAWADPSPTPSPSPTAPVVVGSNCPGVSCDIPTLMAQLKAETQDQRYAYAEDLFNANQKLTDVPTLLSLLDMATQGLALSNSLQDGSWIPRQWQSVIDLALAALDRYDTSDAATMISRYGQLSTLDPQFQLLVYWSAQVPQIEDLDLLQRLTSLGSAAEKLAEPLAGTSNEYVLRQARALLTAVTQRYLELDPYNEGVYDVVLTYPDGHTQAVKMVSINQDNGQGLEISFALPDEGTPIQIFTGVAETDSMTEMMSAVSQILAFPATLNIQFDRSGQNVSGTIIDTRQAGTITFSGTSSRSVADLFGTEVPSADRLSPQQIEGVYQGEMIGISGTLILKYLGTAPGDLENENNGLYGATFTADNGEFTISFSQGRFVSRVGAFSAIANLGDPMSTSKLVVSIQADSDGNVQMNGFSYAARNGLSYDVSVSLTGAAN